MLETGDETVLEFVTTELETVVETLFPGLGEFLLFCRFLLISFSTFVTRTEAGNLRSVIEADDDVDEGVEGTGVIFRELLGDDDLVNPENFESLLDKSTDFDKASS